MAFLRSYSEQGDAFGAGRMRAGRLLRRKSIVIARGKPTAAQLRRAFMRHQYGMGDPFSFRLPKFIRKASFKKIGGALAKVAKVALPIALPFVGGPLGALAGAVLGGGGMASAGGPENPAPELTYNPPPVGTVGEAARGGFGYQVPGVEVFAERYRSLPPELTEMQPYEEDEDEDYEDEDDYSDVDDSGETLMYEEE